LLLKEEQVKSTAIAIDPFAFLKNNRASVRKGLGTESGFDFFFNQFQAAAQEPAAAVQPALESTTAAVNSQTQSQSAPQDPTPIQRLEYSLRQTGQPLERYEIAASDRPRLEQVLERSGYSKEDIKEILAQASNEDGSINLGTLFKVLEEYAPVEGPVFLLNVEDKPLLAQLLEELGVSSDKIQSFIEALPEQDGKLVVKGLPALLAQAMSDQKTSEAPTVDREVLSDLLTRLGLSQDEVKTLLNKAVDGQGRCNPKTVLALLQAAAARQDKGVAQALKELAGRMKISPRSESAVNGAKASDASRIRDMVVKFLEAGENASVENAKDGQSKEQGPQPENAKQVQQTAQSQVDPKNLSNQKAQAIETAQAEADKQALKLTESSGTAPAKAKEALAASERAAAPEAVLPKTQTAHQRVAEATGTAQTGARLSQAATAASTARSTLPNYVVRQVADQIAQMARNQTPTLRLALKPAHLGELTMKLSVKEGVVKATLVAETLAAKNTLEAGLEQLRQQLGSQGLKVERLEVMVQAQADQHRAPGDTQAWSGSGQGQGNGGQEEEASEQGLAESEEESMALAAHLTAQGERINLFA
jgi:flagellar hook-length control protein FliK